MTEKLILTMEAEKLIQTGYHLKDPHGRLLGRVLDRQPVQLTSATRTLPEETFSDLIITTRDPDPYKPSKWVHIVIPESDYRGVVDPQTKEIRLAICPIVSPPGTAEPSLFQTILLPISRVDH